MIMNYEVEFGITILEYHNGMLLETVFEINFLHHSHPNQCSASFYMQLHVPNRQS